MLSTKPPVRPVHAAEAEAGAAPELAAAPTLATEGYFVLNWSAEGDAPLVLQQAVTPDFRSPLDRPIASAGNLTLTGFDDGFYYFRAGPAGGPWSGTVEIEVRHHSLARAFGFFSLGLGLFLVLSLSILLGHRRSLRHDHGT